ncbi:amidohydrolase family protein [Pigmentiphaga soli]|uniref:Amidohydrolase family protein n=1 Tax=Pigmentiphaga soli TaxID=1007095 RepID=A0ABP8GMA4_9BURK
MLIIDTHAHAALNWFCPVQTLLGEMDANGVAHAILVQHRGAFDHAYLLDCAKRYPGRFKVVGLPDPDPAAAPRSVEAMKRQGMAGIRMFLGDGWRPEDPAWRVAGELGMVVSVIGKPEQFASPGFRKLLDNCPDTRFCLEHLARHGPPGTEFASPPHDGFRAALECGRWPNTTIKVPGLGEILPRPAQLPAGYPFAQSSPLFEMALEAFGPERMMFGSDFPPCAIREGYANALEGIRRCPAFRQGDALAWILGRSAARLWSFPMDEDAAPAAR